MAVVTADMLAPEERAALHRAERRARTVIDSLPRQAISATRAALILLGTLGVVLAPEPWLRALCALPIAALIYLVGATDGRRDLAADLIRDNVRRSQRAPRAGEPPEGG